MKQNSLFNPNFPEVNNINSRQNSLCVPGTTPVKIASKLPGSYFKRSTRPLLSLILLLLCLAIQFQPALAQSPENGDVAEALATSPQVRVIVALHSPAGQGDLAVQQVEVERAQKRVTQTLSEQEFKITHTFETLPGMVGEVTQEGLEALLTRPEVASVALDLPVEAALAESVSLIKADQVWSQLGFTGAGVNVAVLDTGVEANHPNLVGSVIAQHCFNQTGCPTNGELEADEAPDENGHGTHVAGIIASRGVTGSRGVAPGVGLVVVRVLGKSGNGYTSDVLAGLDWLVTHQAELKVRAVNLSLGGGSYSGNCDTANATTQLYRQAVQSARAAGMVIFAASGNSGLTEQMMAPACVSGVVSVGSSFNTTFDPPSSGTCATGQDPEQVACYSNSSSDLDLLAPGTAIQSTIPGGSLGSKSGTSMATAHVTGVAALLAQAKPALTPNEIEQVLAETGVPVLDTRNGRTTPRVDALAAALQVTGGNSTTVSGKVLLQGRSDHSNTAIFLNEEACTALTTSEITPDALTAADGSFQIILAQGQSYQCLQAVQPGYLVGQHDTFKSDLGTITLPGGDVTGDGMIDLFDLATVASHYGTTVLEGDIDHSGQVDILDLAIIASNYKLVGPATWPGE
jgi:subtilisin family serine protease